MGRDQVHPNELSSNGSGSPNQSPHLPESVPLTHYVVVREDLPRGFQSAQLVHAAGESISSRPPTGTHAVVLAADDERHLLAIASRLERRSLPYTLIEEVDAPFDGQATAIGIPPTRDRKAYASVLGRLRLLN